MVPTEDAPGIHHDPPPHLAERLLPLIESAGPWFRIHRRYHEPLWFGQRKLHRFDAPDGRFGVLYAATHPAGAFIETFGRNRAADALSLATLKERHLARVQSRQPLRLVDLTGPGLSQLQADGRLTTGELAVSQRWSAALHDHPVAADGILYRARHDPEQLSVAVWHRAAEHLSAERLGSLADPQHAPLLGNILDRYQFGLITR